MILKAINALQIFCRKNSLAKMDSIRLFLFLSIFIIGAFPFTSQAKNKTVRKVQEVNFGEMNLKGTIRNPDGAYLVQRKGLKFIPLHNLQKNMDQKIRETDLYLR